MNGLLDKPILPTLTRLSIPNTLGVSAQAVVAIAETSYVSALGIAPLAAMALVFPMIMLQAMMSTGAMGGGVSSAISRALGANDMPKAQALARHACLIAIGGGALFLLVFQLFPKPIFALLGGSDAALEQAVIYARVAFLGAIPVWLVNTFVSILRGSGNMRIPAYALIASSALQIGVGAAFGLGLGPFPRLGMAGVASGIVVANVVVGISLYLYLASGRAKVTLSPLGPALQRAMFYDILKVGAVACVAPIQSILTVLIITALVASYGTEALAGFGIGTRLEFLLVPITFAIGSACVPMVGMAVGAGKFERARRVVWTGGAMAATLLGLIGLVVALFPQAWVSHFTADATAASVANQYLRWAGPCFTAFGLGLCLYFAMMGSGNMVRTVVASTVRLAVVALGGFALVKLEAPLWTLFALVGVSMIAYGAAVAAAVYTTRWSKNAN